MTDIRDPKIDEKPPPYECSSCGVSTWSWNEAKHHICKPAKQEKKKAEIVEIPRPAQSHLVSGQQVEDLVRITLETRTDHPDWSQDRIVQSVMKSYGAVKTSG